MDCPFPFFVANVAAPVAANPVSSICGKGMPSAWRRILKWISIHSRKRMVCFWIGKISCSKNTRMKPAFSWRFAVVLFMKRGLPNAVIFP